MRRSFLSLFLFLTTFGYLTAQSNVETLLNKGIELSYNFQLKEAEKVFYKVIEQIPEEPDGYHYIAQLHLWAFIGTRDPGEYLTFLKFSEIAAEKADKKLLENSEDAKTQYLMGMEYFFRSMAHGSNNSPMDAFWASKRSVRYFDKCLRINPEFYDAYFGLGMFEYALSFVPGIFKWALRVTGLNADKETGLNKLKLAFTKGKRIKRQAAFFLGKIYSDYLAEYDSAAIYLKSLQKRYPQNTLVSYQYAIVQIKQKKFKSAEEFLKNLIRLNKKNFVQLKSFAFLRLADIYFWQNKFAFAIKNYDNFLLTTRDIDYSGYASYRVALCYEFLNDREKAKQYFIAAGDGNLDIYEDSYAKIKSEKLLESGLTPESEFIIRMQNNLKIGKYKIVRDSLTSVVDSIKSEDLKGIGYVCLAEASYNLKNFEQTLEYANYVDSLTIQNEGWVVQSSYFWKAKAYYKLNEIAKAREYLLKAENNSEYPLIENLEAEINYLKRRLAKD
jgi:tetratricopeptide (TPR) repeat protein